MDNFSCPRTCPKFGDRWCRFRPILDFIGPIRVDSETVRITVQLKDHEAVKAAVLELGGEILGIGKHKLFSTTQEGLGFRLKNWRFPLVLGGDDGTQLYYDDYNGRWGNKDDLKALEGEYSIQVAMTRARNLGWQSERIPDGLKVYHPGGGHMEVLRSGTAEAFGFNGVGCHDALVSLGIDGAVTAKAEMCKVENKIMQQF